MAKPRPQHILLHCMLAKRIWLQHFWFSIAMSGKMKANQSSGQIWNLLATYKMGVPLKSTVLSGRTSRTCLRPVLCWRNRDKRKNVNL